MNKYEKLFTPIRIGNRILKNRIEAAPSNQSIESIVYEVGFSSANYFEVVFRKEVGMPPTVYRRMRRE